MRGRSCPQPFLVERSAYRPDAFLLLPRWATRSPPHPPQCAHWGTFPPEGKALGGGGTAGWNLSFTNMLSNIFSLENASQIGLGIPEETAPLSYQRQRSPKRANESERAMTPGVQGQSPGPLSPHFSGEMGTPAGQAGQRGAAPRGGFRAAHPKGTQYRPAPGRWSGLGPAQVGTCEVVSRPVPGGDPGFL